MRYIDRTPDHNLDRVARIAIELSERLRDEFPADVFAEVYKLCEFHPAKAAQLLMTLAAFFNPDEPLQSLMRRVEGITDARVAVA